MDPKGETCESCGYREAIVRYRHGHKNESMDLCESCFACACANEAMDEMWEADE